MTWQFFRRRVFEDLIDSNPMPGRAKTGHTQKRVRFPLGPPLAAGGPTCPDSRVRVLGVVGEASVRLDRAEPERSSASCPATTANGARLCRWWARPGGCPRLARSTRLHLPSAETGDNPPAPGTCRTGRNLRKGSRSRRRRQPRATGPRCCPGEGAATSQPLPVTPPLQAHDLPEPGRLEMPGRHDDLLTLQTLHQSPARLAGQLRVHVGA